MGQDFKALVMSRIHRAVLFDLGNTLAAYYRPAEFEPILIRSVQAVGEELRRRGISTPAPELAIEKARHENREAEDFAFTRMEDRLVRIFGLAEVAQGDLMQELCRRFLEPIFECGRVYDDTFPVLNLLRRRGYLTAIVSNAPWGSPPFLWRQQLAAMHLTQAVNEVVLCGDVGWRKPAPQIFHHAVTRLGVRCEECVFVGDELQWDVSGSAAVGMDPVLIDRNGHHGDFAGERIRSLLELPDIL
jgi:putative hydrolase of the HAD superfamily